MLFFVPIVYDYLDGAELGVRFALFCWGELDEKLAAWLPLGGCECYMLPDAMAITVD